MELVEQRDIIMIEPMDEAHALALFEKKLGMQGGSQDINELARALEYIPLAIVQAAAYISDPDRGYSVRQYLADFQESDMKKVSLLGHEGGKFRRDWEAQNSVLITWQISFDCIRQTRPSATRLLSLMSFFDCQGIPEALLRDPTKQDTAQQSGDNDSEDDESQSCMSDGFQDDILLLKRYTFISITVDRAIFKMHGLVQLATRRWLEANGELEKWKQQCIKNLDSEFPTGEYENWAQCQVLFPHAKAAARQRPQELDSLLEWASLLYKAAWYDWEKGNGAEGEKLAVKAMKTRQKHLGLQHEETLRSVKMLAHIYLAQGRLKEAEELAMQMMETRKKHLSLDHENTLSTMHIIGSIYSKQGRWKEAEEIEAQVVEELKKLLGAEDPRTLTSMGNLASMSRDQGRLKEAEELELQVIEKRKKLLGGEHPDTLLSITHLATTYLTQGRFIEAEKLFVQVIKTITKVLGADHLDTLSIKNNLAATYLSQGRSEEAEELFVQVLEASKILGPEHPNVLGGMNNLATTYLIQGRWEEAEVLFVQMIEKKKEVLGAEHPDTLTSMANLAFTWRSLGRGAESLDLLKDCVKLQTKILGANHPSTLFNSRTLIEWQTDMLEVSTTPVVGKK